MTKCDGDVVCDRCQRTIARNATTGQPAKHRCDGVRYGIEPATPYERVMRHVRRVRGGHLMWTGYLMNGVPALQIGRRKTRTGAGRTSTTVRRVVWIKHNGGVPDGAHVIARCGKQRCVALELVVRPFRGLRRG